MDRSSDLKVTMWFITKYIYSNVYNIISELEKRQCFFFFLACIGHTESCITVEDSGESQSESENSVSDSVDDNDDSVAEISRSFRSRQELCEQLNVNHMIQRIFLITLDNSK